MDQQKGANYDRSPRKLGDEIVTEGGLRHLRTLTAGSVIQCCALDPKGILVAVGCANGDIKVFMTKTGDHLYTLKDDGFEKASAVTDIVFLPRAPQTPHILVASYVSGLICHWEISSKSTFSTIKEDRQPLGLDFSPDFSSFAVCGSDASLRLYDAQTKVMLSQLQSSIDKSIMDGHMMRIFAVKFHPLNDHLLVSGGWDNTIQMWDLRSSHAERSIYGPHVCGHTLDFTENGKELLAGSWRRDNALQVFDFAKGELLETYDDKDQPCQIYASRFLGKQSNTILCGGSQENVIRLIESDSKVTLGKAYGFSQGVYAADARPAPPGVRRHGDMNHRSGRTDTTPPQERGKNGLEHGVAVACSDTYCYLFSHFVR